MLSSRLPIALLLVLATNPSASAEDLPAITQCGNVYQSGRVAADIETTAAACLVVKASGITIDGGGYQIKSAGEFSISVINRSDVVIQNVATGQEIQIHGDGAARAVIRDSQAQGIGVFQADDVRIEDNRLERLRIQGLSNRPTQRAIIRRNFIQRPVLWHDALVRIRAGEDGTTGPDGAPHCARGDHVFEDNTLSAPAVGEEPLLLYVSCDTHSSYLRNTIVAGGLATGILMRDKADDNLFEGNVIHLKDANRGAVYMHAGIYNYSHPRRNVFRNNVFHVDRGRSLWLYAVGATGNVFERNLFRTDAGPVESVRIRDAMGIEASFHHNTFYNGGTGGLLIMHQWGKGIVRFYDNIFATRGGMFGDSGSTSYRTFVGDRNLYHSYKDPTTMPQLLQYWRAASGSDTNGAAGDPKFTAPATGDFRLTAGSAAIGLAADGDAGAYPYQPTQP